MNKDRFTKRKQKISKMEQKTNNTKLQNGFHFVFKDSKQKHTFVIYRNCKLILFEMPNMANFPMLFT